MRSPRESYDAATRELTAPFAVVDLAAFRANAADLAGRAGGTPIRVASKSVRCRALLREALGLPGFAGVMAFTLPEALWLAADPDGAVSDDVLVAYPTTDTAAIAELAADPRAAGSVTLMADSVAHLDLITRAAPDPVRPIKVCIDVDTSWQPLGPRMRIGAHRSPLRTPAHAAALARAVLRRPQLRLDGLMAYEAQIAGVGDAPPGRPLYGRTLRWVQNRSRRELAARRAAIVEAVRGVAEVRFVNGGGTGSLHTTSREPAVTEVAAGSGLYQPHLFDHYTGTERRPAALFALPVVRRPAPGVATALGGGYPASGAAGADRLPLPYLPEGLAYSPTEGPGEVQTPLVGPAADGLAVGDRVWMRHAKAGELCERFAELHLIDGLGTDEARVVRTVPTYRGEGRTFL
ncbi:amino acid deaminase/aldolase [Nocardiopsis composta]|uniref:D-serine deaminase-like pyridoxal phosphate-dependent protein n=1 Tax=Nocardiopsis composta TaxID=157465 RepID=A0A7W8VFY4_9ACTN|nr:amino acid deaminase/aldolase [Nocardiopsis composta]MBB5434892.1 D-serine deaminase-like pyridoxal phosphate-dependent protein [Nocardiopsis composta]